MSAMVDKGGGGRDILKSYNPPPLSYASVLSGRRAQSFFSGSTPILQKRNSDSSTKELGRREKQLSESISTEPLPGSSRAVPSSYSPSVSTGGTIPPTTAPYHSSNSATPNLKHVETMDRRPAYTQKMDQKCLPGHVISNEKVKPDGNESRSSGSNPNENPGLDLTNVEPSRNRKTSFQDVRNFRVRDEPNERRIWSPPEHPQRRSDDDVKRGQYMDGRSVNNKYRNDTRPRHDNLEDKENQSNEKRKTFLPDQDGWLTKVPIQKKAKNEKPFQQGQKVTRFGEGQRYAGQQRPLAPRPFQQGRGKDPRREYQGGRQTIVYSNSRGSPFGRRQSTRGIPPERNLNTSGPRRNDLINSYSPPAAISVSLSSTSATTSSDSTAAVTVVPPKLVGFLPQPIVITSTTVSRPDLTPPPAPACGTFSYRDILTKGIQSPPTPVRASKIDQRTETEKENKFSKILDTSSAYSEINTSGTDKMDSSPAPQTSQKSKTICSAPILIPRNAEEKIVDQYINQSATSLSFSTSNEAVNSSAVENSEHCFEFSGSHIQLGGEFLADTSQSLLIPRSDPMQTDQASYGPPPGLTKCSPVKTSLMLGVPPGFQQHVLETSRISSNSSANTVEQADGFNFEFCMRDSSNISAMPTTLSQILAGNVVNTELEGVQNKCTVNSMDPGTSAEKDEPSNFSHGNGSEIGDSSLHYSLDSVATECLHRESNLGKGLENSEDCSLSENLYLKAEESPANFVNPSDFSENSLNGGTEQNQTSLRSQCEDFETEHHESSIQFLTTDSSISSARISDSPSFHLNEMHSESTIDDDTQKKCEVPNPSLNQRPSPRKIEKSTSHSNVVKKLDEKEGEEELASAGVLESKQNCEMAVMEGDRNKRESECQLDKPLSAGELLQQIQSNQNIFNKKGLILNKIQENLSFPRNKKNTERAPAPPPTPNDDSYSGGWGSTPVEDTDPEGSPFHLITSAAKELEHSISSNPMESRDMSNIGSDELKGDDARSECLNTNFEITCNEIDSSKTEGETTQSYNRKIVESGSCSDIDTKPKTVHEEHDFSSDKSLGSCQDTTYKVVIDRDMNYNKLDDCNLNLSDNVENLQQAIGKDLKTIRRSVQPIVIKPMSKLEAYFPNASQTWNAVSEDEPKLENTEALPRRVPKTKFRSNDSVTQSSTETVEYGGLDTHEVNVDQMPENVSNLENKYEINEPTTIQEIEQSPASSKREWLKDDHSSMSPDIYSSMNADGSSAENHLVNSTSLTENIASFTSEIQSSIPSNTNDIWSTNQGKPNLTLPKSNLLNMERPEISPLETLLKHSSATSINLSVNYFKDTNTKVSTTVLSPIPSTSAQLLTTTVTSPKEQRSLVCSSSDSNYDAVPKLADAASQPSFMGIVPNAVQQTVSSNSQERYHLMQPGSNVISGRSPNIPSAIPPLMQTQSLNHYPHQSPLSLPAQMNIQPQEMDYQQLSRMSSGQHGNLTQQPPHMNYVQPPPAAPMQYPNMFDPRWSNNYSLDVNQPEWLNINRFPSGEREFVRPPQIHPLSQPVNIFNYPPPSIPAPKEGIFPNFNYPPPTFQPGYRLQALPGFLQRPPPPLPPQYSSGYYNRTVDTRNSPSLRPPLRQSPNRRDHGFGNVRHKLDNDRIRPPGHLQNPYQDVGNKPSPNEGYTNQFSGGNNMNSEHSGRYDPNHGNKLQRPGGSRQPQDPTLSDYIPRNLDPYNKNQAVEETSFNSSWKQRNLYNDKRSYGSGRRSFKSDHKEEVPYPPLPSPETYSESENPMSGSRRKNTFKGNLSATEPAKGSKPHVQEGKPSTPIDYHKHEKPPMQMQYSNPNDMFLGGSSYPGLMPPLEFGSNQIAFGYPDNANDPSIDKGGNSMADYTGGSDKPDCDDSQLSHASSPYDVQDFCSGGWKYYHETITSPSGLRIHQSTYVPYPNPCGSMSSAYLSTNDVRARIQWLGFKKAHELYTAKINALRSLRMDVTVVCSKGGAVCCNSDILGTCSAYFHDRLFGRTDEYITIFVNVPSKIMKHFLQMMSCGEVFVPINDVNEVIMKAPIYLNLNM